MSLQAPAATSSLLSVSDLHLGLWEKRNLAYSPSQKTDAFRAVTRYAVEHGVGTFLMNGDVIDDDRARRRDIRRDARRIRPALDKLQCKQVVIPGNHDAHVPDRLFRRHLGPVEVRDVLHREPQTGVVATHGHLLTRRLRHLVEGVIPDRPDADHQARIRARKDDVLHREFSATEARYKVLEYFEARSDTGRIALERFLSTYVRSRDAMLHFMRRVPGLREIAYALDLQDVHLAGQVATLLHGWGAVVGHNHSPGVYEREVWNPRKRMWEETLVGNSGSFIQSGMPLTAVHAQYPTMTLLTYDPVSKDMVPTVSESLRVSVSEPFLRPGHPVDVTMVG